jgi:hypothetical protein
MQVAQILYLIQLPLLVVVMVAQMTQLHLLEQVVLVVVRGGQALFKQLLEVVHRVKAMLEEVLLLQAHIPLAVAVALAQ